MMIQMTPHLPAGTLINRHTMLNSTPSSTTNNMDRSINNNQGGSESNGLSTSKPIIQKVIIEPPSQQQQQRPMQVVRRTVFGPPHRPMPLSSQPMTLRDMVCQPNQVYLKRTIIQRPRVGQPIQQQQQVVKTNRPSGTRPLFVTNTYNNNDVSYFNPKSSPQNQRNVLKQHQGGNGYQQQKVIVQQQPTTQKQQNEQFIQQQVQQKVQQIQQAHHAQQQKLQQQQLQAQQQAQQRQQQQQQQQQLQQQQQRQFQMFRKRPSPMIMENEENQGRAESPSFDAASFFSMNIRDPAPPPEKRMRNEDSFIPSFSTPPPPLLLLNIPSSSESQMTSCGGMNSDGQLPDLVRYINGYEIRVVRAKDSSLRVFPY